ncbi:NUDIX domain-containing protein [Candidatus Kaiserbacteria bacterium]|nr:NUDIX domain-containing protein [Candidatus Kaiserbacteria bacterium]USN92260.1 MAG: NUDIX domain-containing protein [Candidatus Nomurabacteria bacterium]
MEKLNILDEQGNILGQEYRDVIHQKGLLHGEVHVWCVTPENELIFQHRAKDKDTYPDLLDATAGGHVDLGETYEESAIKELKEETGLDAEPSELIFLRTEIRNSFDEVTGMTNHPRRNIYLLKRKVAIEDLTVEAGKALGFVSYPVTTLLNLDEQEASKFIPTLLDEDGLSLFKDIEKKI